MVNCINITGSARTAVFNLGNNSNARFSLTWSADFYQTPNPMWIICLSIITTIIGHIMSELKLLCWMGTEKILVTELQRHTHTLATLNCIKKKLPCAALILYPPCWPNKLLIKLLTLFRGIIDHFYWGIFDDKANQKYTWKVWLVLFSVRFASEGCFIHA